MVARRDGRATARPPGRVAPTWTRVQCSGQLCSAFRGRSVHGISPGGYSCTCQPGYTGNGLPNGTRCTDINECVEGTGPNCVATGSGGVCTNSVGSFACSCLIGMVRRQPRERDGMRRSQQYLGTNDCVLPGAGGVCTNTPSGSYSCSCLPRWDGWATAERRGPAARRC